MKPSSPGKTFSLAASMWLLLSPLTSHIAAETSPASSALLLAMGANAKQVMHYGWKQKVTVLRKGKPAEPVIDQVGFDSSGQLQRTRVSAAPQQMGGIRGKIAAEVKQNVEGIMQLAGQYNKPQQMVEAVQKATISQTAATNIIEIRAGDLVKPGDAFTMIANGTTHLASHVDVRTSYDGSPMSIAQDYERLPDGPNVMKTMKVSVPGKDLVVNVESYDYTQKTTALR